MAAVPAGWSPWTLDNWASLRRKDPLNLFLTGSLGSLESAFQAISSVGFCHAQTGADQWFRVESAGSVELHRNDEGMDDACGLIRWQRRHTRLYQSAIPDTQWGLVTAAPIHHDLPKPTKWIFGCGEIATSFNGPRDEIAQVLETHGHDVTRLRTRERRSVRQCDGSPVAPDGWIVFVG